MLGPPDEAERRGPVREQNRMNALIDIAIGSVTVAAIVALVEVMLTLRARRRRAAPAWHAEPPSSRYAAESADAQRAVAGGSRTAD
jgi:hypothetical protein